MELITYITTGEFDKKMTEEALCIPTDKANADAWPAELAEVKPGFDSTTTYYDLSLIHILHDLKTRQKRVEEAINSVYSFSAKRSFCVVWKSQNMLKILC